MQSYRLAIHSGIFGYAIPLHECFFAIDDLALLSVPAQKDAALGVPLGITDMEEDAIEARDVAQTRKVAGARGEVKILGAETWAPRHEVYFIRAGGYGSAPLYLADTDVIKRHGGIKTAVVGFQRVADIYTIAVEVTNGVRHHNIGRANPSNSNNLYYHSQPSCLSVDSRNW